MLLADRRTFGVVVPELGLQVSELWYLGVSSNPMTHLPDDIGTMQNMLYLIAAWCKFKKLPQSISNLMHLHELNVRGNELTELPTMHNLRCLQELYVQVRSTPCPSPVPILLCLLFRIDLMSVTRMPSAFIFGTAVSIAQ